MLGDTDRAGWWQCRAVDSDRVGVWFAVVWSSRHPDGTRIELLEAAAAEVVGSDAVCTARYGEGGSVVALEVGTRGAPKAPLLWFAEIRESTASPPAVNLVAFSGHGVAHGSLLDSVALREVEVASADQLGAVRWYPATGEVDQIYVNPQWRRRTVAGALIAGGTTLSLARGWKRFWGDGQRTDMGDQLRAASPWRHRAAELTVRSPPMTPLGDEA